MFSVVIEIKPKPAPRMRINRKNGGRYYDAWYTDYKNKISNEVDKYVLGNLFEENLKLELLFYKNCSISSRNYGDVDNLAKPIMDALNGHLWKDDTQVKELYVDKNTSIEERIIIKCSVVE